jgi:hypothetical protein
MEGDIICLAFKFPGMELSLKANKAYDLSGFLAIYTINNKPSCLPLGPFKQNFPASGATYSDEIIQTKCIIIFWGFLFFSFYNTIKIDSVMGIVDISEFP